MKICVIGAGFFGLHVANQIHKRFKKCEIQILEANSAAFKGASSNNQCRLHMGFHYPRSGYTVYQSILGFDRFLKDYSAACNSVASNLYAINKNGYVTAEKYFAVMDSFHLDYKHVDTPKIFKKKSDIEAVIEAPEQWVDLDMLKKILIKNFKGSISLNISVSDIDPEYGKVFVDGKLYGEYDFVVNATYSNPNLGASEKFFDLKYELAALVNCETDLSADTAVTIMDGPFVSIYPSSVSTHTLSSVIHTPFMKSKSQKIIDENIENIQTIAKNLDVKRNIFNHVNEFINVKISNDQLWLAPKVKLASDHGDSRVTEVKREGRLMAVLCGKLDAAFSASDDLLREISIDI